MASRARFVAPVALAALSAVAALSLGRVVDSARFVAPVLGAAILPHVVGAVCRRRTGVWPVTILVNAGALAVFVVLALEPSTTSFGIPGAATWHALERQLDNGWHLLRTAPAPAPATDGAILLAVIAVWCMAGIADWFAFRRQATLGAIAPALVFFVWTSTLGSADDRVLVTAAFCAAAGAFLLAQNLAMLDRRRSWLVSQHTTRAHWLLPASALGVTAIVAALLIAPVLPGAGSDPLLDFANPGHDRSGGHSYRPRLAPFVDIGAKLDDVENIELFTVRSAVADYWRIAALDTYSSENGGQWTLRAEGGDSVTVGLPADAPPGTLRQEFHIGALGERWLPAAYRPVAINLPDTLVVRSSATLVADASSVSNLEYTVASELPPLAGQVTPAQEQATQSPVPRGLARYAVLPPGLPAEIGRDAQRIVNNANAITPYAKAKALRDYFRDPANNFVYDTRVGSVDSGNAISAFLRDKHGFCVQFASAYAVMARSLGIPARVAVGFTPGERRDDVYHVSSHNAHAWPEIWLAGLGWTHLFDPTPATSGSIAGGSNLHGESPVPGGTSTTVPTTTTTPTSATTPTSGSTGTPPPAPGATPTARPNVTTNAADNGTGPWVLVLAILVLVGLVIGAYVGTVLVAKSRRRARRRDAADAASAITGAWEEALDRLREADVVSDPTLTPLELARAAPRSTSLATERPLRRLARTYTAARYGDGPLGTDDVAVAWTSVDELERALTSELSWLERWRRRLDASTLKHSLRHAAGKR